MLLKMCYKIRRNIKMEYQVTFFNFLFLSLVIILLVMINVFQRSLIFQLLQQASTNLFFNQEINNLNSVSATGSSYINYKHYQSKKQIEKEIYMFRFTQQIQDKIEKMNTYQLKLKNLSQLPYYCYFAPGVQDKITLPQDDKTIMLFNYTTQFFNQFIISFYSPLEQISVITDLSKLKYFAAYPQPNLSYTYDQAQRPWFQNHVLQQAKYPNEFLFFSPIYQLYNTNYFAIAMTGSIIDLNQNNIGIVEKVISIDDQFLRDVPFNILLINIKGEIILIGSSYIKEKFQHIYLFNETLTGFNETQWQQIQNLAINNTNETLQLMNSKLNVNVILKASFFSGEQVFLVIFSNVTDNEILLEKFTYVSDRINYLMTMLYLTALIISLVSLFLVLTGIKFIFLPLKSFMNQVKIFVKSMGSNTDVEIFKILLIQNKEQQNKQFTFQYLNNTFFKFQEKIFNKIRHKNQYCIYQENLQYNVDAIGIYQYKLQLQKQKLSDQKMISKKYFDVMKIFVSSLTKTKQN